MIEIRIESGLIWAIFGVLLVFGGFYNTLITWMEDHGYIEGYTALMVAGGVLVTLAGVAILSVTAALIALGAFTASGLPMMIGSVSRHMQRRAQALAELRREVHANNTQRMAEQRKRGS